MFELCWMLIPFVASTMHWHAAELNVMPYPPLFPFATNPIAFFVGSQLLKLHVLPLTTAQRFWLLLIEKVPASQMAPNPPLRLYCTGWFGGGETVALPSMKMVPSTVRLLDPSQLKTP